MGRHQLGSAVLLVLAGMAALAAAEAGQSELIVRDGAVVLQGEEGVILRSVRGEENVTVAELVQLRSTVAGLVEDLDALRETVNLLVLAASTDGTSGTLVSLSDVLGRLGLVEGKANDNAGDIGNLDKDHGGRITALEDFKSTTAPTVSSLSTTVGGHTTSINKAAGDIAGLTTRVGDLEGTVDDTITPKLNGATSGVSTLAGRLDGAEGRLDGAEGRLDDAEGRLDGIDTSLADREEADDNTAAQIAAIERHWIEDGGNLVTGADMTDFTGWTQAPSEGTIVYDVLPDGQPVRAMKSTEKGTSCYDWALTNRVPVDPASTYQFSLWIRAFNDRANIANYFGFHVFDANGDRITSGVYNNPYFFTNKGAPDQWQQHQGYLLGVGSNTKAQRDSNMFMMPPNARYALLRFGSCYSDGDNRDHSLYARPSIRKYTRHREMTLAALDMTPKTGAGYHNLVAGADLYDTGNAGWTARVLDENLHYMEFGPYGAPVLAARSSEVSGSTGCYGGWAISNKFPINPAKSYEFSLWIKSNDPGMNNYFGFYIYDGNRNQIGGQWGNPYFKTRDQDQNAWQQWRGILAHQGTGTAYTSNSYPSYWEFPTNTRFAVLRFGSCYSQGTNKGETFYTLPSVFELSG